MQNKMPKRGFQDGNFGIFKQETLVKIKIIDALFNRTLRKKIRPKKWLE
jgi:glutaredoxin-related protein